ncbi:Uncharacterised protein [Streptococcus suis]|uniref:Uncharacterized protein n=1 Tax=Streptococcus suis TaxID=1307 RepID=A0A0Z8FUP0_STRSU|nr:Uncharacterised protein [Streptococcus suis]CYW12271.1 Uncharacterised protein [Streptococcus suis]
MPSYLLIELAYNSVKKDKVCSALVLFTSWRRKRLNFLRRFVKKVLVVLTRVRQQNQRFWTYRLFFFELFTA